MKSPRERLWLAYLIGWHQKLSSRKSMAPNSTSILLASFAAVALEIAGSKEEDDVVKEKEDLIKEEDLV
jgi:hypothetical protein